MMRYNRNTAALLLVVAVIILISTSFLITSTTVSDTDPSTYVIVPMLMIPLFVLFSLKSNPMPKVDKKSIAIGVVAFSAFIALTLYLRTYLTIFFVSFRADMLLMPLAILALVLLLFGVQNVKKFRGVLVYTILASPIILYPLLLQSNAFSQINSLVVYGMIKPFVAGVQYIAPITLSANGYTLGIGQACVSIGVFVALALFLIPIAYLYEGTLKRKIAWVTSGILLLLLLNIIRMFSISLVWLTYGPNETALVIHNFIGVLLFYITIIVAILISRFYGLSIARPQRRRKKQAIKSASPWPVVAAFAFSILYVYLTLNYSTALLVSPLAIQNSVQFNYSNKQLSAQLLALLDKGNYTSFVLTNSNGTEAFFTVTNSTISPSNPILIFMSAPDSNMVSGIPAYNQILGKMKFFNKKGSEEQVFDLLSNGTQFFVYNTNIPFVLSNDSSMFTGVYVIMPLVDLPSNYSCNSYDPLYSWLYNIQVSQSYNQTVRQNLLSTECFSYKLIWS